MPKMIAGSISLLSDAGLGMAMFSLGIVLFQCNHLNLCNRCGSLCYVMSRRYLPGLFMALQPRLIACGTTLAAFAMAVRFLSGPAVMAASSIVVGLRGVDLHAAIVQVSNTTFRVSTLSSEHMI